MRTLIRSLILSVCFVVAGWAAAGGNLDVRNFDGTAPIAHLSFNTIAINSTAFTFRIRNNDISDQLTGVTVTYDLPVNCTPTASSAVPLTFAANGAFTNVVVNINPVALGINFSFRVNISSSDATVPTLSPYQFSVGTIEGPEITVKRGTVNITDGSSETLTGVVATQAKTFTYQITN